VLVLISLACVASCVLPVQCMCLLL
jgi:hypothetical protein